MFGSAYWRPDGSLIGKRELSRRSSCADLAAAAAVVLASWESDVHPEFGASLPPVRATIAAAPPEVAAASPAPKPQLDERRVRAGRGGDGVGRSERRGRGSGRRRLLVVARRARGGTWACAWRWLRELSASCPLGTGRVRWRHLVAALGPDGRLPISSTRFGVGLHAEALLSSLSATGEGLTNDRAASSFDPGVGAGFRLLYRGHAHRAVAGPVHWRMVATATGPVEPRWRLGLPAPRGSRAGPGIQRRFRTLTQVLRVPRGCKKTVRSVRARPRKCQT